MRKRKLTLGVFGAAVALIALAVAIGGPTGVASASKARTAAGGVATAKAIVAKYEKQQPAITIPVLPKRPPKNVNLGAVLCTIPQCTFQAWQQATKAIGWHLDAQTYALTPQSYVAAWGRLVQQTPAPKVVGFEAVFPNSLVQSSLATLAQRKTPTVTVTTDEAQPIQGPVKACYVCAPQFTMSGRLMADAVIADAGGPTKVVWVEDPTLISLGAAYNGFKNELGALSPQSTLSTLTVSVTAPASQTVGQVVSYLQANPDVKYVAFSIDALDIGVPQGLASAGLGSGVKLVGRAPQAQDLAYLKAGQEFAEVAEEDVEPDWRAVDGLARLLEGVPLSKATPAGWHQILTTANASKVKTQNGTPIAPGFPQAFLKAWHVSG